MVKYRIPIRGLKVSTNKIYGGQHWTRRKEHKDSILGYAASFCRPVQRIESYPVEIRYRFVFSSRALDTLNCAYMAKMFEDALCALGALEDDAPKYVARSVLEVAVATAGKGAEAMGTQGKKADAKNEDWLEITINSYKEYGS